MTSRKALMFAVLLVACPMPPVGDDEVGDGSETESAGSTTDSTESDTTGESESTVTESTESESTETGCDGSLGCPCAGGELCDLDLVCADEVCVPGPGCWTDNGVFCTAPFNDLLVNTPCNGDIGSGPADWPYECAAGQLIDATGWDDAWCSGGCWGRRGDVVMAILPECMIDTIGAVPADVWADGYCSAGSPLPTEGWDEWRCGDSTCTARLDALWVTPNPLCMSGEWTPCL